MSVSFFVPGIPVPQGRARSFRLGDGIGHYDDPKSKAWKAVVAQVAGLQRDRWFGEEPLKVILEFFLPIPKSMKIDTMDYRLFSHTKKPDIDNLSKGILDSLNGICYKDDSQVCELSARKEYSLNVNDGVRVTIERLK